MRIPDNRNNITKSLDTPKTYKYIGITSNLDDFGGYLNFSYEITKAI